jgi:hypothetical protein
MRIPRYEALDLSFRAVWDGQLDRPEDGGPRRLDMLRHLYAHRDDCPVLRFTTEPTTTALASPYVSVLVHIPSDQAQAWTPLRCRPAFERLAHSALPVTAYLPPEILEHLAMKRIGKAAFDAFCTRAGIGGSDDIWRLVASSQPDGGDEGPRAEKVPARVSMSTLGQEVSLRARIREVLTAAEKIHAKNPLLSWRVVASLVVQRGGTKSALALLRLRDELPLGCWQGQLRPSRDARFAGLKYESVRQIILGTYPPMLRLNITGLADKRGFQKLYPPSPTSSAQGAETKRK